MAPLVCRLITLSKAFFHLTLLCSWQPCPFPKLHRGLIFLQLRPLPWPSGECIQCPLAPDASDTCQLESLQLQIPEHPAEIELRDKVPSLTGQAPGVTPLAPRTALLAIPGCISRLVARWLLPCQAHPDVTMSNKTKRSFSARGLLKSSKTFPSSSLEALTMCQWTINESLGLHP